MYILLMIPFYKYFYFQISIRTLKFKQSTFYFQNKVTNFVCGNKP